MSLTQWQNNGWLRPHKTDKEEIANLLAIADRDIADAANPQLSDDWKFGIAYNAALKLCTIMLYAAGYRPENTLAHYSVVFAKFIFCFLRYLRSFSHVRFYQGFPVRFFAKCSVWAHRYAWPENQ